MWAIPSIKNTIGQVYQIWYLFNNMHITPEVPAWSEFRKITRRHKTETITIGSDNHYFVESNDCRALVKDILLEIKKIGHTDNYPNLSDQITEDLKTHQFSPHSIPCCKVGNL